MYTKQNIPKSSQIMISCRSIISGDLLPAHNNNTVSQKLVMCNTISIIPEQLLVCIARLPIASDDDSIHKEIIVTSLAGAIDKAPPL